MKVQFSKEQETFIKERLPHLYHESGEYSFDELSDIYEECFDIEGYYCQTEPLPEIGRIAGDIVTVIAPHVT